jgi:hypothetical protein
LDITRAALNCLCSSIKLQLVLLLFPISQKRTELLPRVAHHQVQIYIGDSLCQFTSHVCGILTTINDNLLTSR